MIVQPTKESDGSVVLTVLVESLDQAGSPEFREVAAAAIASSEGRVVIDCSKLDFIDSSGLGAFLHTNNLLTEERRPVRLKGVGAKVRSLLELMQVHRLFEMDSL